VAAVATSGTTAVYSMASSPWARAQWKSAISKVIMANRAQACSSPKGRKDGGSAVASAVMALKEDQRLVDAKRARRCCHGHPSCLSLRLGSERTQHPSFCDSLVCCSWQARRGACIY
jgi:hypothetical protein